MKKLFDEFKRFCTKGNILELATGVMIGGAFSTIVNSLVNDMLMPLIGLITGGVNLGGLFIALDGQHYASIDAAKELGVGTLNYGAFLQAVLNFFLIAITLFIFIKLFTKAGEKLRRKKEEEEAAAAAAEPAAPAAPTEAELLTEIRDLLKEKN